MLHRVRFESGGRERGVDDRLREGGGANISEDFMGYKVIVRNLPGCSFAFAYLKGLSETLPERPRPYSRRESIK